MIALSDNPSIPRSGADDYCPENMSKKLLRSLYYKVGRYKNQQVVSDNTGRNSLCAYSRNSSRNCI